jgi:hypothetical protein
MLLAHRATVVALAAVLGLQAASCGPREQHAPLVSATCTMPPCAMGGVIGGSAVPGETDSGSPTVDSGAAPAIDCRTDPTSLITLCSGSRACQGPGQAVFIDPVAFASCGFVGTGIDVECVCNGNSLCPVAVQTSCSYIAAQLKLKTYDEICAPALTGGCVDLSNRPLGTGGLSGAGGSP